MAASARDSAHALHVATQALMRADGDGWQMDRLDTVGGLPLGVTDDVDYEETTVQLRHGQTVVLYTDGITEARSPDGTMFGLAGIERSLNACTGRVRCAPDGVAVDGRDCGYFSPPDVACSEIRAAHWTGRCAGRTDARSCLEWHARWATSSCYPEDEHLEARRPQTPALLHVPMRLSCAASAGARSLGAPLLQARGRRRRL